MMTEPGTATDCVFADSEGYRATAPSVDTGWRTLPALIWCWRHCHWVDQPAVDDATKDGV